MNKLPIALGSLTVIVAIVFASLAVAGVFDGSSDTAPGDGEQADTAALCVEGVEDCDDTGAIPVGNGDDAADAPPPDDNGDVSGTCPVGTPDCNDTPGGGDPDQPLSDDAGETDDGEALAIEAAFAALEAMDGPPASEVDVAEVRAVDWPNACLGVETPGVACAQVITPGYVVILDTGILAYTFHTDANGHAILAGPAQ